MANGREEVRLPGRVGIRRGIYILPNLFTTASLFAGFYGIISSLKGFGLANTLDAMRRAGLEEAVIEAFQGGSAAVAHYYEVAAWAIIISAVFDSFDGAVARLTRSASDFGAEYDSLADLVSFGVAPAILMYAWALEPFQRVGWLAGFLFVVCAALRLARFNVQAGDVEKRSFQGLPSPGAAGTLAVTALFYFYLSRMVGEDTPGVGSWFLQRNVLELPHWVFLALTVAAALLMVSNVRYRSPSKNLDPVKRYPFFVLLVAVGIIVLIAAEPHITLFFMGMAYFFSGPIEYFLFWKYRKQGVPSQSEELYKDDLAAEMPESEPENRLENEEEQGS